jgi:uncharacterized RDD family membrane protein YckC
MPEQPVFFGFVTKGRKFIPFSCMNELILIGSKNQAVTELPVASATPAGALISVPFRPVPPARCPLLRRLIAEAIDALVPLPFLVPMFPPWSLVSIIYTLFCDSRGASVGKKLMGISVVCVSPHRERFGRPCNAGRSLLRNAGLSLTAFGFVSAWLAPIALSYLLIEVLTAVFGRQGRRLGDLLAGTQVIARETKEAVR